MKQGRFRDTAPMDRFHPRTRPTARRVAGRFDEQRRAGRAELLVRGADHRPGAAGPRPRRTVRAPPIDPDVAMGRGIDTVGPDVAALVGPAGTEEGGMGDDRAVVDEVAVPDVPGVFQSHRQPHGTHEGVIGGRGRGDGGHITTRAIGVVKDGHACRDAEGDEVHPDIDQTGGVIRALMRPALTETGAIRLHRNPATTGAGGLRRDGAVGFPVGLPTFEVEGIAGGQAPLHEAREGFALGPAGAVVGIGAACFSIICGGPTELGDKEKAEEYHPHMHILEGKVQSYSMHDSVSYICSHEMVRAYASDALSAISFGNPAIPNGFGTGGFAPSITAGLPFANDCGCTVFYELVMVKSLAYLSTTPLRSFKNLFREKCGNGSGQQVSVRVRGEITNMKQIRLK